MVDVSVRYLYLFTHSGVQHDLYIIRHMMFVSFNSNTTDATCGAGTAYLFRSSSPVFSGVRVA